jgi:hypothetical protein
MPKLGFKPTIPAFERANTIHALDRAATEIGLSFHYKVNLVTLFCVLDEMILLIHNNGMYHQLGTTMKEFFIPLPRIYKLHTTQSSNSCINI